MKQASAKKLHIISLFFIIGLIAIAIVGIGGFYSARKILKEYSFNSFTAIRESKKQQIETYFSQIRNQCQTFAADLMIVNAMHDFKKGYNTIQQELNYSESQLEAITTNLKEYYKNEYLARLNVNLEKRQTLQDYFGTMPEVTKLLQYLYISHNPNPVGQKDNLNNAGDGSYYSTVHAKYHPIIRNHLKKFKYYDIFLVDIEMGAIVYSCYKEVDFSTSLLTGPFKSSNIASLFSDIRESDVIDFTKLVDFKFYDPSYAKPASFIGTPIYDGDKKIGVLIFQIPVDQIDNITMNNEKWQETGFGKTGEAFLIGSDYLMRTDSRMLIENPDNYFDMLRSIGTPKNIIDKIKLLKSTILVQEVNSTASREVIRGNTNAIITENYLKELTLCAFTPVDLVDLKWGLLVEMDYKEVKEPVNTIAIWYLFLSLGAILIVLCIGFIVSRYITYKKL